MGDREDVAIETNEMEEETQTQENSSEISNNKSKKSRNSTKILSQDYALRDVNYPKITRNNL